MPARFTPSIRVRARTSIALAVVAALAACTDGTTAPHTGSASPEFSKGSSESNSPNRHLYRTREYYASRHVNNGTILNNGTPDTSAISYHNGPVLQNGTNVVAIYWGSSTYPVGYQNLPAGASTAGGTGDGSLVGTFLSSLTNLADVSGHYYFAINQTYSGQTGALINPTVAYTGYWNTVGSGAPAPASSPTDANIVALIQWGLNNGKLTYNASTVYVVFTGNGVNLGGGFGSQYCAYHTHGSTAQGTVVYAAMPYVQQYASSCTARAASPNPDAAANSEVSTLAHEIEETTTNPMASAWYDDTSPYDENADKCAYTWGTTATAPNGGDYNEAYNGHYFLVQRNWVRTVTMGTVRTVGGVCDTGLRTIQLLRYN